MFILFAKIAVNIFASWFNNEIGLYEHGSVKPLLGFGIRVINEYFQESGISLLPISHYKVFLTWGSVLI